MAENLRKTSYESVYCGNCGKYGHSYRRCTSPITSLGVIVFKMINNVPHYLMIQRKDTLGFVEFLRGKYNLENINYVYKLFEIMTKYERDKIENNSFEKIWNDLWMNKTSKQYRNEYENSKKKFNILKKNICIDGININLKSLNENIPIYWNSPEWGFPKGRRNMRENDKECAMREFSEETGIAKPDYEFIDCEPFSETFLGTNNIRYKHIYFLGKYHGNSQLKIDVNNIDQVSEISNLKWFKIDEAIDAIRPYNYEKKNVIRNIHEYVTDLYC